jgi:hypothetical protein
MAQQNLQKPVAPTNKTIPINSTKQIPTKQNTPKPKNNSTNSTNNSKSKKTDVKLLTIFNMLPVFLHSFVKIMPIGLYLAAILESMLFNDIRGFFVFIGLFINDLINIGYNYVMKPTPNPQCAVIRNLYTDDFFSLSTPHSQYIAFITSFVMASMYFKKYFFYSTFSIFMVIVVMTIWSRIAIGCENMLDVGFNLLFGAFRGIVYYVIVKDFYEPEDVTPEDHWLEAKIKAIFPDSDDLDEMFQ